jgi:hypothetical protein
MPPAPASLASLERFLERRFDALERKIEACTTALEGDGGIRVRLSLLESAFTELRKDLSDQGKAPPTPPPAPPPAPWRLELAPGSGKQILIVLFGVGSVLGLFGAGKLATRADRADPDPVVIPARVEDLVNGLAGTGEPVPTP